MRVSWRITGHTTRGAAVLLAGAILAMLTNLLFVSIAILPPNVMMLALVIGGFPDDVVDAKGYIFFFIYTAMLGIPAILMILYLMKRRPTGFA